MENQTLKTKIISVVLRILSIIPVVLLIFSILSISKKIIGYFYHSNFSEEILSVIIIIGVELSFLIGSIIFIRKSWVYSITNKIKSFFYIIIAVIFISIMNSIFPILESSVLPCYWLQSECGGYNGEFS
jgi:hypothetical protein